LSYTRKARLCGRQGRCSLPRSGHLVNGFLQKHRGRRRPARKARDAEASHLPSALLLHCGKTRSAMTEGAASSPIRHGNLCDQAQGEGADAVTNCLNLVAIAQQPSCNRVQTGGLLQIDGTPAALLRCNHDSNNR